SDILTRVQTGKEDDRKPITRAQMQALIESGACDDFGLPRKGMLIALPAAKEHPDVPVVDTEFSTLERAARERARSGILLSASPLDVGAEEIANWRAPLSGRRPMS